MTNLDITIDLRSDVPAYVQIIESIQRLAASGALQPGDQLPTVRQLAADLRVNFNTVARAYRMLDEAGLISTQQGRGTYIWEAPSAETLQHLRQNSLESLTRRYLAEAARLASSPAEIAEAIEQHLQRWKEQVVPPNFELDE